MWRGKGGKQVPEPCITELASCTLYTILADMTRICDGGGGMPSVSSADTAWWYNVPDNDNVPLISLRMTLQEYCDKCVSNRNACDCWVYSEDLYDWDGGDYGLDGDDYDYGGF
jgi:hypothetical protein